MMLLIKFRVHFNGKSEARCDLVEWNESERYKEAKDDEAGNSFDLSRLLLSTGAELMIHARPHDSPDN